MKLKQVDQEKSAKKKVLMKKYSLFCIASFLLFISIISSVVVGTVGISPEKVITIIYYKIFHPDQGLTTVNVGEIDIVWLVRLPRAILSSLVGASLALAGVVMQSLVKNPLADPYIMGISSGASLGATFALMLGVGASFGSNYVGICAFIGALISAMIVLIIGSYRQNKNASNLLLVGVALSSLGTSLSSFIVYISSNREGMQTLNFWLLGSISGANWETISVLGPIVFFSLFIFSFQARILNLMLIGDHTARTLGRNIQHYRYLYVLLIAILIGFVVFSCGVIGFVGLIVPHMTRLIVGTNHRNLIPFSIILGGIFMVCSDIVSRIIISGTDIPIGIVVSTVGAPVFLYLSMKQAKGVSE